MEIIDQLSVALGFATLAGINLYLTAFVTGLAVRMNWLVLSEQYGDLSILGSDVVLAVSGALLVIEIMADKVPWVDSLWDSFHTLIRPVGGGLLAISTLGTVDPQFQVIIGLVASGATLVSHGAKAGTRLVINNSPEPVTNATASAVEDAAVIGGLMLMHVSPKVMAAVCVLFLAFAIFAFPKMFRRIRGFYWLLYQNLVGRRPHRAFPQPGRRRRPGPGRRRAESRNSLERGRAERKIQGAAAHETVAVWPISCRGRRNSPALLHRPPMAQTFLPGTQR